jgi:hypothetical protein
MLAHRGPTEIIVVEARLNSSYAAGQELPCLEASGITLRRFVDRQDPRSSRLFVALVLLRVENPIPSRATGVEWRDDTGRSQHMRPDWRDEGHTHRKNAITLGRGSAGYTNTVPGSAFRGCGLSQTGFAVDSETGDRDRFELRRRNVIGPDEAMHDGLAMGSHGLGQCLDLIEAQRRGLRCGTTLHIPAAGSGDGAGDDPHHPGALPFRLGADHTVPRGRLRADASGRRCHDLPLKPDRVLHRLAEHQR